MAKLKKEMAIGEVVAKHPDTVEVFMKHGMHCVGCAIASMETVEQGAKAHGMDIKKLMGDLNKAVEKKK
ncbi:MAG: DUF1858 domain-containing protein [Candidatus Woesearchaeota archaeon]